MYCIKCGVKLADTEKQCPLCKTIVFHPDILREEGEPLYPGRPHTVSGKSSKLPQILLTAGFLLPILLVLVSDLQFNREITWSGIVIGALLTGYIILILPFWFKKPNPVIFVPCWHLAAALYLHYLNFVTGGDWFLSFAFPITGSIALIVTAVTTLLWYVRRGKLYIFGGAIIALGGFMLLLEFLMDITFPSYTFIGWSLFPLVTLVLLGGLLIFLGIYRPARETMEQKFFI